MNEELKKLYEADVEERKKLGMEKEEVGEELLKHDKNRRQKVKEMIEKGKLGVAEDFHHASVIFQHGETSDDYKLANQLAKKAMGLGEERAKWLYAASLDRWFLSAGKPQKFGTQFVRNSQDEWELAQPLDPSVTDEERAKYNVPPLSKALESFKQKYIVRKSSQ